jgi:hypothetical protein
MRFELDSRLALRLTAPVPFHPKPSTWPMHPTSGDPHSTGPRPEFPMSGCPNVTLAIPPVVTRYPDVIWSGRRWTPFNYRRRRTYPYVNLSIGDAYAERRS